MSTVRLSDKYVDRLQPVERYEEYTDVRLPGFGCRVGLTSKVWFVRGRAGGKSFKRTLGKVEDMLYADAFDQARTIIKDAEKGIVPGAPAEKTKIISLRVVLEEYLKVKKTMKASSKDSYKETIERYLPKWLDLPLKDIDADKILKMHEEIGQRSPASADYTMRIVRALFNYADEMYEDMPIRNPVKRLSRLNAWYRVPRKETFLRPEDIPLFFKGIKNNPGLIADFLLTLLLTGSRKRELGRLKTEDVHLHDKTIVLRDTKGTPFLPIPMCDYLVPVIERRLNDPKVTEYLFYSNRGKLGYLHDVRGSIEAMFPGMKFTPHDMRRTYLSYADESGVSQWAQKRLVGHALPFDVTQGYIQFPMSRLQKEAEKIAQLILEHAALPTNN